MSFSKIKEIANQSDYRDVNLYIFKKKSGNRDPLVHNIGIDKNTKNKLREHILSTINRISIDNEIVEYNIISLIEKILIIYSFFCRSGIEKMKKILPLFRIYATL